MLISEAIDETPEQTLLAIQMVPVFSPGVISYPWPGASGNHPRGSSRCPGAYPWDLTAGY
jgi:hypothetical protein